MQPDFEQPGVQLYLGDCLRVLPTLDVSRFALLLTDPPYGVCLGLFSERRGKERRGWTLPGDVDQEVGSWVCRWGEEQGVPTVVFAHPSRPWPGAWEQYLVWDKGPAVGIGGGQGRPWKQTWELIQTRHIRRYNGQREDGILVEWVSANFRHDYEYHPCQKPVRLLTRLIGKLTAPGDVVIDPCMGSGSTGLACLQLGRQFVGVEIDPHYFGVARKRLSECDGPLFATAQQPLFPDETGLSISTVPPPD